MATTVNLERFNESMKQLQETKLLRKEFNQMQEGLHAFIGLTATKNPRIRKIEKNNSNNSDESDDDWSDYEQQAKNLLKSD